MQLSGHWRVHSAPLDYAVTTKLPDDGWFRVPDCAHLQPILYPDQPYWGEHLRAINDQSWIYRRKFTLPDVPYQRARLRFEGVDYFARVWVNHLFAGEHEGHFAPFEFDVTPLLQQDGENSLVVSVTSPWDKPNPRGAYPTNHVVRGLVKGLYEHGEGVIPPHVNPLGIWRPVSLLLDDGLSIDHVRIRTQLDGQVDLRLRTTNSTVETWQGALSLSVQPANHEGGGVCWSGNVNLAPGTQQVDVRMRISEPHLWWCWDQGDPNLYHLEVALLERNGRVVSTACETFGIRTVRLERSPRRFIYWLNERPVFIRGTSYIPSLYLSETSSESMAHDLRLARNATLNLLRVHVHVSPPELYEQCDQTGMLIWQDFELNWSHDHSPAFEARARRLQREMIDLLSNHPSVITWSCHNEPTMVFARRKNLEQRPDPVLYADVLQQDSTRPVFICSGQMDDDWQRSGDSHSYYGAIWSQRYTDIYHQHFRFNSEFGFEAPAALDTLRMYPDLWRRLQHLEEQIDDLWAYQAALIQYQIEHFRRLRAEGCGGYIHFWLVDLVPQVGCGVLDSCRQPKGGYAALQQASQPLHISLDHDGRRPQALWIFNDTLAEYEQAHVCWQVLAEHGAVLLQGQTTFDIQANCSQRVMPVRWRVHDCAHVELVVYDRTGELLCANRYLRPFRRSCRPRGYPWKFDPYLGTKVFDRPDAPSLADQSANRLMHLVPLILREKTAEWVMRQHLPTRLVSAVAHVVDYLTE